MDSRAGSMATDTGTGASMGDRDRGAEAPAPGNWRVTARPMPGAVAAAASQARPAPSVDAPAAPGAGPAPSADAPARAGGHPLLATAICVGLLLLSLAGQGAAQIAHEDGPAFSVGFVLGGALFGAILWGIAYAITIRKASPGWKAGSLIVLALLGGFVALAKVAGGPAPSSIAPPIVREGK